MRTDRRPRWRFCLWTELVAFSIFLLLSPEVFALCPVEEWTVEAENLFVAQVDDGVDGIGGSGLMPASGGDEDGIGGSGIYGTVTGFGSICLNGRRLQFGDGVALTMDGVVADSADVAVGQVVLVDAAIQEAELHALSIDVQHMLQGPVTAIGVGLLEVMGEVVLVDLFGEDFDPKIEVGTRLSISGLRRPDGRLVVSRVDLAPQGAADMIRGLVTKKAEGGLRIGGVALARPDDQRRSSAQSRSVPSSGDGPGENGWQWMVGHWNQEAKRFSPVRARRIALVELQKKRIGIEGYVTGESSDQFQVGGIRFRKRGEELGSLVMEGERVRVRGVRARDGVIFRVTSIVRVPERRFLRALNREDRPSHATPPRLEQDDRPRFRDRDSRLYRLERPGPGRVERLQRRRDLIRRRSAD